MQALTGQQWGGPNDFFDDSTRQSTCSSNRRLSRGSSSHRAMRVVKPSSASNSPQAAWNNRRRTMMHDSATSRRTQQVLEQLLTPEQLDQSLQPTKRSERPVSWHPGSFMQQQQAIHSNFLPQQQQMLYPSLSTQGCFPDRQTRSPQYPHLSPGMIASSANTSPASTFSPLPLQYAGFGTHNSHYVPSEAWQAVQKSTPFYPTPNDPRDYTEPFPMFGADHQLYGQAAPNSDWQAYIMQGMNTTTPPTPESLIQPEPSLPPMPQESPAFQTLDEPEDDGEVLVGMGLYDAPEKLNEDPQLDNYRSTVCSLLGSRFRPSEPQGKGLKLEETWAPPPKSDDEDEDEDSGDEPEADSSAQLSSKTAA
ncbi:hypothetical protein CC79DRAFT_1364481 [Sarocladium strictum]